MPAVFRWRRNAYRISLAPEKRSTPHRHPHQLLPRTNHSYIRGSTYRRTYAHQHHHMIPYHTRVMMLTHPFQRISKLASSRTDRGQTPSDYASVYYTFRKRDLSSSRAVSFPLMICAPPCFFGENIISSDFRSISREERWCVTLRVSYIRTAFDWNRKVSQGGMIGVQSRNLKLVVPSTRRFLLFLSLCLLAGCLFAACCWLFSWKHGQDIPGTGYHARWHRMDDFFCSLVCAGNWKRPTNIMVQRRHQRTAPSS